MNDNYNTAPNPFLVPLPKEQEIYPKGLYETFPAFDLGEDSIFTGFNQLSQKIISDTPKGLRVLVIDSFPGVNWKNFRKNLEEQLVKSNADFEYIDFDSCLRTPEEINADLQPFLGGDDRIFGMHYPLGPEVFFDAQKISALRIESSVRRGDKAGKVTIIAGVGASLLELWDELWYIDIPKDIAQNSFREGKIINTGYCTADFEEYYKRSYFIEWPAFSRQKKRVLNEISLFIDGQNEESPAFISGHKFRNGLEDITVSPFRVRPWFYPGPWGGAVYEGAYESGSEQAKLCLVI